MSKPIEEPKAENQLERLMKEMMIKKEPMSNLTECLDCYSADFLTQMAERIDAVSESSEKNQIIEALRAGILERMPADILFDDLSDLKRYTDICADHSKDAELEVFSGIFKYLIRGWMFFFVGEDAGQVKLTMPEEVMSFVSEYLSDKEKLKQADLTKELMKYLWGLDHLYGAFEKKQFINVWNNHHDEPLSEDQLNAFLTDIQRRYPACHVEGDYIISNSFTDYHVCTELLRSTQGKEYHMPTPEDIEIYQDAKVDMKLPQYEALKQYLRKKLPTDKALDNSLYLLESYAVLESTADDVMMAMDLDEVAFDTPTDAQEFLRLYSEFANNVRLWTQRGMLASDAGIVINYTLADVSREIPVTYKKVGRNDPCPCGSGKKYKNCCGKVSQNEPEEDAADEEVIKQ